jgi:hypothetical protein
MLVENRVKKTIFFVMFAFVLECGVVQAQSNPVMSNENVAIMKTIYSETDCWMRKDYKCWADANVQSDNQTWFIVNNERKLTFYTGWTERDNAFKAHFSSGPKIDSLSADQVLQRSNIHITIYHRDTAYVSFDQHTKLNNNYEYNSKETRLMQKINGHWKIAHSSVIITQ